MANSELIGQYQYCISISNMLQSELEKLGKLASEYLGFDVEANLCSGNEVEFRKMSEDDGYIDNHSIIFLEDFEKEKGGKDEE